MSASRRPSHPSEYVRTSSERSTVARPKTILLYPLRPNPHPTSQYIFSNKSPIARLLSSELTIHTANGMNSLRFSPHFELPHACLYFGMHRECSAHRGQKGASVPLEQDLQAIGSCSYECSKSHWHTSPGPGQTFPFSLSLTSPDPKAGGSEPC